jgi:hypothetical protein
LHRFAVTSPAPLAPPLILPPTYYHILPPPPPPLKQTPPDELSDMTTKYAKNNALKNPFKDLEM